MNFEVNAFIYIIFTIYMLESLYPQVKKINPREDFYNYIGIRLFLFIFYLFTPIGPFIDIMFVFVSSILIHTKSSSGTQSANVEIATSNKPFIAKLDRNHITNLEIIGITDVELFTKQLYEIFLEYENAYSSSNYAILENICSDQFFQVTSNRLDSLKAGNKKRIFSDIVLNNFAIISANNKKKCQDVSITYDISLSDCTIDCNTGIYYDGSKHSRKRKGLKIKFIKQFDNSKKSLNCPSCGAPLKSYFTTCEYCKTTTYTKSDWKIDSIN